MRMRDISLENRPRERLEKHGPRHLSDAELLAIILNTGTRSENVIDIANRLISTYSFSKLSHCSLSELKEINGIGAAKACQIAALFELTKRHSNSMIQGKPIKTAKDVFEYCSPTMASLDREQFMVIHLDSKNRAIIKIS